MRKPSKGKRPSGPTGQNPPAKPADAIRGSAALRPPAPPPAPITSEPIPPIRRAEESEPTPAQRTYMAHAEFDPSGSGRAIPVRPSDEDFLRYFTGRLLPSFRAPVRGGYRVFAPPDPMTVAPALESDQLKAYGLGRVIRGEER